MFNLGSKDPVVGTSTITIDSPPDQVFHFITVEFFENYPKWSPEVVELEQLTDGPMRLGSIARQVRVDQGRRSESKFHVTRFEPCQCLCFAGLTDPYRCTYDLHNINSEDRTYLTFKFELLELLTIMRPFEKIIRVVVQDGAERTTRNLKRLIEASISTNA